MLKFILIGVVCFFLRTSVFAQGDAITGADSFQTSLEDSSSLESVVHPREFSFQKTGEYYKQWSDRFPFTFKQINGMPAKESLEIPRKAEHEDWRFWFCLFLLAFLALIRSIYAKDFEELNQTFKNWGVNQQVVRELGVGAPLGLVLLNVFSSFVLSFYVFLLLQHFDAVPIKPAWLLMIFAFVCVEAGLLLRYLLLKAAELIFPFRKEIKLYNFYEIQVNRMLGILLFPLLLLIAFSVPIISLIALYASIALVATMLIVRYIKGFSIGISYFGSHIVHFLLYLCALEIAPVLIVIRLLLDFGPIKLSL